MQRQATAGTEMPTLGEPFVHQVSAARAALACQPGVHREGLLPSLFRFESKDRQELSPTCIGNRLRHVMIAHHALDIQGFKGDQIIVTNKTQCQLMMKVQALVAAPGVSTLQEAHGLSAASPALPSLGDDTLSDRKLALCLAIPAWILDLLSGREHGKRFQAHVNPDLAARLGQRIGLDLVAREYGIPLACLALEGTGLDRALDRAVQLDLNPTDLGEVEPIVPQRSPGRILGVGEAVVAIVSLESRETQSLTVAATSEESLKRLLQSAQDILKNLRVDLSNIRTIQFQGRELAALIMIVQRNAKALPSCSSLFQRGIVEFTTEIKRLLQALRLLPGWIEAILEGFAHLLPFLRFYVLFQYFQCHAAGRLCKVGIGPERRQAAPERRELLSKQTRTTSLDLLDEPVDAKLRVTSQEQVNMVGQHLKLNYLLLELRYSLQNYRLEPFIYRWHKDTTAILGTENNVIPALMHDISVALEPLHGLSVTDRCLSVNYEGAAVSPGLKAGGLAAQRRC